MLLACGWFYQNGACARQLMKLYQSNWLQRPIFDLFGNRNEINSHHGKLRLLPEETIKVTGNRWLKTLDKENSLNKSPPFRFCRSLPLRLSFKICHDDSGYHYRKDYNYACLQNVPWCEIGRQPCSTYSYDFLMSSKLPICFSLEEPR